MKSLLFGIISLFYATLAVAAEAKATFDESAAAKYLNRDLTETKKFFAVYAILQGSAEKIGLDRKEISDYVNLRFKNLFTGFPIESLPKNDQGMPDKEINDREWGMLWVVVWTVGDDYPVAYCASPDKTDTR